MTHKDALFETAREVREHAHAPYSGYFVGAALVTPDGTIHAGCNVENVAYPEGTCAEAGAIAAMVANGGSREISEVLVIAAGPEAVSPCGGCRQKLAEFGGPDVLIHLATLDGVKRTVSLGDLLPGAFSTDHLKGTDPK